MQDQEAILDHPVIRVIRRVAQPDPQEVFVIDDSGAELIEYALLRHAHDPSLPDAVMGVFAMATGLYHHAGAPQAAMRLMKILAQCRPKLAALPSGSTHPPMASSLDGKPTSNSLSRP